MKRPDAAAFRRVSTGVSAAVALFIVYALTLAREVTFWDAGEFIAAAHSLGIPHPPGTPLFVLLTNVWAQLLPVPYAIATNLFSAAATALAAGVTAQLIQRATSNRYMALAAALVAGGMSSAWLNATETEVYAASLTLGILMMWAADRSARETGERWTLFTAYLIALAVPLHLSALVAAPVAIFLAGFTGAEIRWRRVLVLSGTFLIVMGIGRVTWQLCAAGLLATLGAMVLPGQYKGIPERVGLAARTIVIALLGSSVLAFLYVRAQLDPAINQGNPDSWVALADMVARKQYAVSPLWPRQAPVWLQLANFGQYVDWQVALSFGPTVLPSMLRTTSTMLFLALAYIGAVVLWRLDRRMAIAVLVLFVSGALGVLVYLNLHAGPSIGYGILPANVLREARERDYFFIFAFWCWGIWAGIGAVAMVKRYGRPAWAGVVLACLPLVLNWRAVTRRTEPEQTLPRAVAEALLQSTPANGVLFVVGDNDSYPLWYAQEVLGLRRDVAVITIPLLPTRWYRTQVATRFDLLGASGTQRFESRQQVASAIANRARQLGRPVAAAMTMSARERAQLGSDWTAGGLTYVEGVLGRASSGRPRSSRNSANGSNAPSIDTVLASRWAAWVDARLPDRDVRPAIDPVNSYFRRLLDCPRQLTIVARGSESDRLDSVCNYR